MTTIAFAQAVPAFLRENWRRGPGPKGEGLPNLATVNEMPGFAWEARDFQESQSPEMRNLSYRKGKYGKMRTISTDEEDLTQLKNRLVEFYTKFSRAQGYIGQTANACVTEFEQLHQAFKRKLQQLLKGRYSHVESAARLKIKATS